VKSFFYISLIAACFFTFSCNDTVPTETIVPIEDLLDSLLAWDLNPNGKTPLSGELIIKTKENCSVNLQLAEDETVKFSSPNGTLHAFNVIGLFAGTTNTMQITVRTEDGEFNASDDIQIETAPLPDFFPDIEILTANTSEMEAGWNFLELNIGSPEGFLFYPIVFDAQGRVRYYIDLSPIEQWIGPIRFTENNSWQYSHFNYLDEFDLLFNKVDNWSFGNQYTHHDFYKKENGNVLFLTSEGGTDTQQDRLIEYNPSAEAVVTTWDFRDYLDVSRNEMNWNTSDWVHTNSISYIENQNLNVVSGRYQGVFAFTDDQQLQWILAPHKGWEQAGANGDSFETADYLLTAVDANNVPYSEEVQLGLESADDFSWTWGQHACQALENGNVVCFDNGWKTNFNGNAEYSRMVEFEIDPVAMTVKQVWEYGKERGVELFSSNISDVDVLPETSNRLMIPGNVRLTPVPQSRMVELKYPSNEVVFEAVVRFKNAFSNGGGWAQTDIVYQGERINFFK